MKIPVREAKNNLSKYGDMAHNGQTVVVSKNGKPWFDIVPHRKPERKTGPLPGVKATISLEDAVAPVSEEDVPGWM